MRPTSPILIAKARMLVQALEGVLGSIRVEATEAGSVLIKKFEGTIAKS